MSKIKIFSLGGLNENRKNMYVIDVDNDIRLERAQSRGSFDITEWNRRLLDDERIFSSQEFKNNTDHIVTNNTNNIEDCYNKIKEWILWSAK